MKILFLANRLPHASVAGGHRLIYQRMRLLADRGHQVGLASFVAPGNERFVPSLRERLHEVETVPAPKRRVLVRALRDYPSPTPAIFWKNYSRAMMRTVGDMVEHGKYDVVVAEFSEMGQYLYRNPYLSAVRKVVSCHRCLTTAFSKYALTPGLSIDLRLKSASQLRKLEAYEFEMYSAMDHILTLTPEDRFALLNHAPELPVSVIPPGIDFDYLDREASPDPSTPPIVMMCGYFADKSNTDAAFWFAQRVWPAVRQAHPYLQLHFVGLGAGKELLHLAARDERIIVDGDVGDLRPYREKARIFINPMRLGSGLRIKVLEAMATALPVVSTSLGVAGIPAQNGENCFIADTPELTAESIGWLLGDAALCDTMGHAAKRMVREKYDIRATTIELEQLFEEVVSI